MNNTDAWDGHALVARVGWPTPWCNKDGAKPGPEDDAQAWFASHLAANRCPGYVVAFERDWRETITDNEGNLDVDQIARELSDYAVVLDEVSKVYDDLTNGRFSKPNTAAVYIIEAVNEGAAADYAEMLCEEIDRLSGRTGLTVEDAIRSLLELANDWSEGAWGAHVDRRRQFAVAREAAEAAGAVNA